VFMTTPFILGRRLQIPTDNAVSAVTKWHISDQAGIALPRRDSESAV